MRAAALGASLFLLALGGAADAMSCKDARGCASATPIDGCGWCWAATTTEGQRHGARPGTAAGPSDGAACSDWTFTPPECQHHTDCNALPDCLNILGTYCGWCADSGKAMRGNATGPTQGSCAKGWISSYDKCPKRVGPQQVHLAYSDKPDIMVLTFASEDPTRAAVSWQEVPTGPEPAPASAAVVSPFYFGAPHNPDGAHWIFRLELDVTPGKNHTYSIEQNNVTTSTWTFLAKPATSDFEARFLVFGDMGRHGGGMVLYMLEKELNASRQAGGKTIHGLIHFGDFAYDLKDNGGLNGDTFFNRIEALAATHPYMTCVGNHEIEADSFANYLHRFSMPRYGSRDMMFHSWDIQKVHFISYSSEVYFADFLNIERQLEWLEDDLKMANAPENRTARPWIIAYGHRPFYCSNTDGDDCTRNGSLVRAGLEKLMHKYGVDLIFEAHEHSYERLWPTYDNQVTQYNYTNPQAIVHIITGAAGCNEGDGSCLNPIEKPRMPWSAFHSSAQGTYAYGHLNVVNDTHLYLDSFVAEEEAIEDAIWIVQEHHGMRLV